MFDKAISKIVLALAVVVSASDGLAKVYKTYTIDKKPLTSIANATEKFDKLLTNNKNLSKSDMTELIALAEEVLKQDEKWIDGYWIIGNMTFQLGSLLNDPKNHAEARRIFVKGRAATRKCLTIENKNPLCKLMLGAVIGKISEIDGIFASLKNADRVRTLWKDVSKSDYNYRFTDEVTMQGSVHYALGLYYRLIPDSFLVDWLFDVQGNINTSISYHRQSLKIDGPNACATLMLAVSLLCKNGGETRGAIGKEALALLTSAEKMKRDDLNMAVCASDAKKIVKDPSLSCGYTAAKQQSFDESELSKPTQN